MSELVSIYLITRDRRELLERAVQSVLNQSYKNCELLIVDDASIDDTSKYLQNLAKENNSLRLFRNTKPKGACYSRNLAIKNANGKYVTGLDDDDYFLPDRIKEFIQAYDTQYSFLSDNSNHYLKDNEKNREIFFKDIKMTNLIGNQIFIETNRIKKIGGFDESFSAMQDYELWFRLIKRFGPSLKLNKKLQVIDDSLNRKRISLDYKKKLESLEAFLIKHQSDYSNIEQIELRLRTFKRNNLSIIKNIGFSEILYSWSPKIIFRYFFYILRHKTR